ncbi:hypothetical protein KORDIASMS9_02663 [Kordia sp. SMS9]|uniref:hypothetical protein n=1 Tax=Kordia sp. SMS9 TaxID=2282170 RepID=UPI000E0D78DF|nr:hypothetical protein [Kordia sp. SMS9]AXG70423.1 hypothetical protein KORDIASMS9_02663 [Kordia sp. SMS9]
MSRSLEEIQVQMRAKIGEIPVLAPLLSNDSNTGMYSNWIYIVSYSIWLHEQIVEENAENSRPHTLRWYREQALSFLDGLQLVWLDGQFQYDTSDVEDVEARRVIHRCAVLESVDGDLIFKIATTNNDELQPLADDVLSRFEVYINLIKDGGNSLIVINRPADLLKIQMTVYVDPQVIDLTTGQLLSVNGSEVVKPVENAVDTYLANLEFNGAFVVEYFRDAIQKAEGVKLPSIENIQWKYAGLPFVSVALWQIPDAGYFKVEDLMINYIPYDLEA